MKKMIGIKLPFFASLCACLLIPTHSFAGMDANTADNKINAVVTPKIFDIAKKNDAWKHAFLTGKSAQVVFMNITPNTNPNNEIGMETHTFDQIIFIADGDAKAVLDGKTSTVKSGDMIFIPEGTAHNVINLNANKPLKIISVYSATDIPANTTYKKKSDASND